jgi:hypothetical protein
MSPSYALPDYLDSLQEFNQAQRAEQANSHIPRSLSAVSAGSKLLLAAIVSGLLVGANQWLESWNDGNLLTDWMVLWLLAFAALALLAGPSRRASASLGAALKARREQRLRTQQDEHYWNSALSDPRLMADIRRAMGPSAPVVHDVARANQWIYFYVSGR